MQCVRTLQHLRARALRLKRIHVRRRITSKDLRYSLRSTWPEPWVSHCPWCRPLASLLFRQLGWLDRAAAPASLRVGSLSVPRCQLGQPPRRARQSLAQTAIWLTSNPSPDHHRCRHTLRIACNPLCHGPHRLVVRTSRRGRDNPGSTPGAVISPLPRVRPNSKNAPMPLRRRLGARQRY